MQIAATEFEKAKERGFAKHMRDAIETALMWISNG